MFGDGEWLNKPASWRADRDSLTVVTEASTDFWRETHYGFTRDSGHFLGCRVEGAFTATLRIRAKYETLYDQAGIMLRVDAAHWIKAGIELSDGEALLSSVLTLGQSDWATGLCRGDPSDLWLRLTVRAGVLRLQSSQDGRRWPLLRLCPFPESGSYLVGPMCCTPERAGLEVVFSDFKVGPATERGLHDLS
jgi:regulation of enolase protein 1 (concanavalin A-like superfamily)